MKEIQTNKLVRDNIPKIIKSQGGNAKTRELSKEEFISALKEKLIEEANEVKNAKTLEEEKEELADVLEIVINLIKANEIDTNELEMIRTKKNDKNGSFNKRIFMESYTKK